MPPKGSSLDSQNYSNIKKVDSITSIVDLRSYILKYSSVLNTNEKFKSCVFERIAIIKKMQSSCSFTVKKCDELSEEIEDLLNT